MSRSKKFTLFAIALALVAVGYFKGYSDHKNDSTGLAPVAMAADVGFVAVLGSKT